MKLIFLDIDGVLVNRESFRLPRTRLPQQTPSEGFGATSHSTAHPACVENLNHVVEQTGARVVVSSVWRMFGLRVMRGLFNQWGVKAKIVGRTPDLSRQPNEGVIWRAVERGDEIQNWLTLHAGMRQLTEPFVIIDDDSDMNGLSDRLVHTQFEAGLTAADAERAIDMLNTKV